jgi:hypothetical protein
VINPTIVARPINPTIAIPAIAPGEMCFDDPAAAAGERGGSDPPLLVPGIFGVDVDVFEVAVVEGILPGKFGLKPLLLASPSGVLGAFSEGEAMPVVSECEGMLVSGEGEGLLVSWEGEGLLVS